MSKVIRTKSLEETHRLAEQFYSWLTSLPTPMGKARVLALRGDLGAGKTAFTQGLAKAMGVRENITSPTFVLMKKYAGHNGNNLVHFDAYRLTDAKDLAPLRFGEYADDSNNVVVVEWPEMISGALSENVHVIDFKFIDENEREITLPYE